MPQKSATQAPAAFLVPLDDLRRLANARTIC
jgi:hypothetical protein